MSTTSQPDKPASDNPEGDDAVIGRAIKWSLVVLGLILCVGAAVIYHNTRPAPAPILKETSLSLPAVRERSTVQLPQVPWTDITQSAGLLFVHQNGAEGEKLLPETMGGGCAFFDYDGDGDQDILLVNSNAWPWDEPPVQSPATMGLFRNDGTGQFSDVTSGSGLDISLYGMGVGTGDFDNDGHVDVFVSALGPNRLLRNVDGSGHFEDVTAAAAVAGDDNQWSTSCGWLDYDSDGDLDLFVVNYVQWTKDFDLAQNFRLAGNERAYGRPQAFEGTHPCLYRNDGDGRFTDVSALAGVRVDDPSTNVPLAKSLGVAFADFDNDGHIDIVVSNDTVRNFLFRNQGHGTFTEIGRQAGVAFDVDGNARGAMGIDAARFRNNNAMGIAIGNFSNEMTALYVAYDDALQFTDEAVPTGLGPQTRLELSFGVFFFDCDLDGRLDLFAANGHLEEDINTIQPSQNYEQSPQLFWNCGSREATEFTPFPVGNSGDGFAHPLVGRGASFADIDNDGDPDLLIATTGQAPRLLRNDQQLGHHWLRVTLKGSTVNRDAIGAWVDVQTADQTLSRQVMPTRSYLSQVELPITFGLGQTTEIERITVRWPDGSTQSFADVAADQTLKIEQGQEQATSLRSKSDTPSL
ncbi:MAG: CRTAC1 family protein [Planctomycetaceae bacterium]